jgi:hypothetical protein
LLPRLLPLNGTAESISCTHKCWARRLALIVGILFGDGLLSYRCECSGQKIGETTLKILVPRITDATKKKDLLEFANRVLQKWFRLPFSDYPKISSCRVLTISDSMGVTSRHGLLDVSPDDAAVRVIRKLNGAFLGGKRVGVKHYDDAAARAIGGGVE